ncbi:hypothetical protein RMR21_004250 [Agrobacterium sp. rho-8.1]
MILAIGGEVSAETRVNPTASEVQGVVESCFSPPAGATDRVIITAKFNSDGSLDQKPEIVQKSDGPLNGAYANAAVRAIIRCQHRLAELGVTGDVRFNFEPSHVLAADTGAIALGPPSPERLRAMDAAARQLKEFAERNSHLNHVLQPSTPEIASLLTILCQPAEAERLEGLPTDQYLSVSTYARNVSEVMDVYDKISADAPQEDITHNIQQLGACFDATFWASRAAIVMFEKFFARTPSLSHDPAAKLARTKLYANILLVIEGGLEAFKLDGLGSGWCDARLRPLVSLIETAAPMMDRQQKDLLRVAVRQGQTCSPAARIALQPFAHVAQR